MSKSKGNVVTPSGLLEQHGSDAVRYWAASSRLGTDAAFDPQNPTQVKIGRRLAIKVLNAAKFILTFDGRADAPVTVPVDRSMLAELTDVVDRATRALDAYDHARALELAETFFWTFCDDYLELVKERAYGEPSPEQASAVAALKTALDVLLRLFAPVIPFATEESWRWSHDTSVHRAPWPSRDDLAARGEAGVELLELASLALTGIRRAKTDAKASQKTPVASAVIAAPAVAVALLESAAPDLRAVGRIAALTFVQADEFEVRDVVFEAPSE
jgi:valyl-tRNA synthetase